MKAFKGLTKKISKGEGGFTLIELLIVIIILGILAAVVAFNVSGFLGQGTLETAKTERSTVQTGLMAGMADINAGSMDAGTVTAGDTDVNVTTPQGNFNLQTYMHLPTHGNWHWNNSSVVDSGNYTGGGETCVLTTPGGVDNWSCG